MNDRTHPSALPSRILMRLHWWLATAWLLSKVPVASLDTYSVGRLRYALLMAHRAHGPACRRMLQHTIRRNKDADADVLIELAMMAVSIQEPDTARELLETSLARAENRYTADAARRLLAVQMASNDGTLRQRMRQRVDALPLPAGALLTLVPISSRYLELWQMWREQTQRYVQGVIVVIAMDDAALEALADVPGVAVLDAREFFAWSEDGRLHLHTRGVLWYLRVLLLQALVESGHPVLVLDLDAIAVGEVQPLLDAHPTADVIAQQDNSIPMDVNRDFGFVICCGFMLWRPTTNALALLRRYAAESAIERDDQLALNHLLARDGIADRTRDAGAMRFRSAYASFVCPDPSLVSRDLDTGTVIRHFHQTGKTPAELRLAIDDAGADIEAGA